VGKWDLLKSVLREAYGVRLPIFLHVLIQCSKYSVMSNNSNNFITNLYQQYVSELFLYIT